MICGIVAVDNKWGIGKDNKLLFRLPHDMAVFKALTNDSIVACGVNTLRSFPGEKPLKDRSTFVLASEGYERDDCVVIHGFDKFLHTILELSKTQIVWIIGGGRLYQAMLPYYDAVYVTKVRADGQADTFFPNLDEMLEFEVTEGTPTYDGNDNEYIVQFNTYTRKR